MRDIELTGRLSTQSAVELSGDLDTSNPIELEGNITSGTLVARVPWGSIFDNIQNQTDLQQEFATKQDVINDLAAIRSGAAAGATAVQPAAIADMATQTWVESQGYLTEHQDISHLATKTELATVEMEIPTKTSELTNDSGFITNQYHDATKQNIINDLETIRTGASKGNTAVQPAAISDMATKTWTNNQGFLKEHQSLANYYNKQQVDAKDQGVKEWADGKFLTQHQSLENYYTRSQTNQQIANYHDPTKENADPTILKESEVINNVVSTSTNLPLSAAQGKALNDRINNLESIGRFLSFWNGHTGMPTTQPPGALPYRYKTGDYYIISVIDGIRDYRPDGSAYTGEPSQTLVTDSSTLKIGMDWRYDGTQWLLNGGGGGGNVIDVQSNGVSIVSGQIASITENNLPNLKASKITGQIADANIASASTWNNAIQPNDNISTLVNDVGYITVNYHDPTKQNNLTVNPAGATTPLTAIGINGTNYSLEGGKIDDVKVNNVSVVTGKIANIDLTGKQNVISDLETIRTNATNSAAAIATYGNIVTHNTSEFATAAQGILADSALQSGDNVSELVNDMGYFTSIDETLGDPIQVDADTLQGHPASYFQTAITSSAKLNADLISDGSTNKTVTQAEKATWNNKQDALTTQTAYSAKGSGTKVPQITTNTLGQVTGITEVDITKTTLGDLGIVASAAELNYVSGVTSSIQTQLNNKPSINSSNNYVPYRSSSTEFANSSLMYNANAMAFTGKVHIGSTDPANYSSKGRLSIYDNTPSTQVSSLALLNYGGGGGCGVAIDMYNTHANSGIPSGRIGILDNNSYSAYMELACKKSGAAENPLSPICTLVPIPASGTSTVTMGVGGDYKGRAVLDIKRNDSDFKPCASETRLTGSGTTYRTANATGTNHKLMAWLTYSVGDILSASSSGSNPVFITNITEYSNYQLEITTSATLGTLSSSTVYFKKAFFKVQDGDGSVKMFIEPNGKMGIGKITPNYELDVVGTINASTDVKINGTSVEKISNKVTTISSASTDTQYPSAKCVYDIVGNIEAALDAIRGV